MPKLIKDKYPEAILLRSGYEDLPDGGFKITRVYDVLGMILSETVETGPNEE